MYFKNIKNTLKSIYLCIRYPFLYPRNRFSGNHYDYWRLIDYLYGKRTSIFSTHKGDNGLYGKAYKVVEEASVENNFKETRKIRNICHYMLFHLLKFYHDYVLQLFHCIPTYTEWDAVPYGWNKAFGKQYLNELKRQLVKDGNLYSFRITDIKEKYGTFRLYCNCASKEVYDIIDKYEDLSYYTCIKCGKPATKMTGGWLCPYCDDCYSSVTMLEPYMVVVNGEWTYVEEENKNKTI